MRSTTGNREGEKAMRTAAELDVVRCIERITLILYVDVAVRADEARHRNAVIRLPAIWQDSNVSDTPKHSLRPTLHGQRQLWQKLRRDVARPGHCVFGLRGGDRASIPKSKKKGSRT